MSGKIWRCICCKKRKDRGRDLGSRSKQKDSEGLGVPPQCEREVIDLVGKVDGSAVPPPGEVEGRAYRLVRVQLENVQKDKLELEAQVVQAKRSVRDLRHEIAVLQKRLQVAENRLSNPPPPPPPSPPPPPPAPPHINPLRALLSIIQKSRSARDPSVCPAQDVILLPNSPVDADASYDHQCPGMNEVLEMIRGGVPLRHVIQVHKGTFCTDGGETEEGRQPLAELLLILRRRKESSDKHVSDGSCDASMEEDPSKDPAPRGPNVIPDEPPSARSTPREGPPHAPHPGEDPAQDARGTDGELEEGQIDGDAVSTTSTLPLTSPLDQGPVDSANTPPCPEGPAPSLPTEGPAEGASEQPSMEGHARQGAGPTDLTSGSEDPNLPADRPASGATLQPSVSPDPTGQSPAVQYLNWERWSDVDLGDALPLKSIFKSVSFMASGGCGRGLSSEEDSPQNPRARGGPESASSTVFESDPSCQSFGSADFGECFPDLPSDGRAEFATLHQLSRPPLASSRSQYPSDEASAGSEATSVLNPNFEGSVDGREMDGLLPESQRAPESPAGVRPESGDSSPFAVFQSACLPAVVEEDRDYHQVVFHC
ncbi:hypothetical protein AAFF_G00389320 [Aldrovandia affinis]|uniref:Uncharacterized protein n=1 Tax=Aldrovandia affinis TaxID=143900 RepID=A0AAD7SEF4_9TELE|nr:hypothetical protein AAFF_G00389320 [Aldrovandia affinis]